MATGRTFKFMEHMHLNQGTKTPTMIVLRDVTWGQKSIKQLCRLAYH